MTHFPSNRTRHDFPVAKKKGEERDKKKKKEKPMACDLRAYTYVKKLPVLFQEGLSSIFQRDFDTNALTTDRLVSRDDIYTRERRFPAKGTRNYAVVRSLWKKLVPHTKGKL